jgi:hypothetical protein
MNSDTFRDTINKESKNVKIIYLILLPQLVYSGYLFYSILSDGYKIESVYNLAFMIFLMLELFYDLIMSKVKIYVNTLMLEHHNIINV